MQMICKAKTSPSAAPPWRPLKQTVQELAVQPTVSARQREKVQPLFGSRPTRRRSDAVHKQAAISSCSELFAAVAKPHVQFPHAVMKKAGAAAAAATVPFLSITAFPQSALLHLSVHIDQEELWRGNQTKFSNKTKWLTEFLGEVWLIST